MKIKTVDRWVTWHFDSWGDFIFICMGVLFVMVLFVGIIWALISPPKENTELDRAKVCENRGGVYIDDRCWRGELFLEVP